MAGERKQKIESMGKESELCSNNWLPVAKTNKQTNLHKKYKKNPKQTTTNKRQFSCWQFSGKSFERYVPFCNLDGGPCVLEPAELNGHILHMSITAVSFAG